jgi:type I restriction enzyme M protein
MAKLSLAKLERHLYAAADILRREGMDAATYKDFIFGMLFLKRSSDIFLAARDKLIKSKIDGGMAEADADANYGENPDYYDEFFVPPVARWPHIQDRLNDASVPFGSVLDQALVGLSQSNSTLEHVLDHIHFMRVQGNKRVVSDDACKDLVRHFSRYRLRTEDFQFSDLLGSAYEFLINMFAESAGKKGGDFYTPRDVIRLMVRILNPTPGLSIYDPTCGSGGMLIISREYIEQSGGDATNLRLCGQVNDASAWSICKINMLLHGIRGADIQLQDTLLHPMHREAGELERFDRVIANPPFVRLVLETCLSKGDQDTDRRKAAIGVALEIVDRARQEVRKVGFWKNASMRELLTRQFVRDLDGSGVCPPGKARDIAQRLVALAKENHEGLAQG